MNKILLSKQKLKELENEREKLKKEIQEHGSKDADERLMSASFKDAAISELSIATKRKRLQEIRAIFKYAKLLPENVDSDKVQLGSWVIIKRNDSSTAKYRLVHPLEASPEKGLLSIESPLGKALLGRINNESFQFNGNKIQLKLM